jgi:hypothetical protein
VKTLTNDACSDWLASHDIAEAPYGLERTSIPYREQFPLPDAPQRISSIARCVVEVSEPFGEALLHFTDWPLYRPDEMALVTAIRAAYDEQRYLIKSPGHLFAPSERDLLIGLFALAVCYQWTAYVYFDHHTTFLCWQGALLDLWTADDALVAAIRDIFQRHNVPATPTGNA